MKKRKSRDEWDIGDGDYTIAKEDESVRYPNLRKELSRNKLLIIFTITLGVLTLFWALMFVAEF